MLTIGKPSVFFKDFSPEYTIIPKTIFQTQSTKLLTQTMKNSLYLPMILATLCVATPAWGEEICDHHTQDSNAQGKQVSGKAADLIITQSPGVQPDGSSLAQTNESSTQEIRLDQDAVIDPSQSYRLPVNNYWYVSGSSGLFSSQGDIPIKVTRNITGQVPGDLSLVSPFRFNVAGGYQWKLFRTELELGYTSTVINGIKYKVNNSSQPLEGNIDRVTVLLNGYYDVFTGSRLRPYLGAGVGVGFNGGNIKQPQSGDSFTVSGTSLSYQLKLGVQYEIAKKRSVFVDVKYLNVGGYNSKPNVNDVSDIELGSANSYGLSIGYKQGF
jgi:opacity protein-like surface antigen